MSLYPSLEDMKVDHMTKAQISYMQSQHEHTPVTSYQVPQASADLPYPLYPPSHSPNAPPSYTPDAPVPPSHSTLYPSLTEYMGLELTPEMIAEHMAATEAFRGPPMPMAPPHPESSSYSNTPGTVAVPAPNQLTLAGSQYVAPLSCTSLGLKRAEVTHGIREVVLCKDGKGKIGLRVKDVNKGVFVALVQKNSPAALGGLRFGDQILQINGETLAGYNVDKVHNIFKKAQPNNIVLAVRDRPFERTVTLHKDSVGHIGFGFKNGKIISIVKDSSAARNGLLTEHHLLEVNGQNVVGLKDKERSAIIDGGGKVITVTVMPSFLYEHVMKHMATSIVKDLMDHTIPDI